MCPKIEFIMRRRSKTISFEPSKAEDLQGLPGSIVRLYQYFKCASEHCSVHYRLGQRDSLYNREQFMPLYGTESEVPMTTMAIAAKCR